MTAPSAMIMSPPWLTEDEVRPAATVQLLIAATVQLSLSWLTEDNFWQCDWLLLGLSVCMFYMQHWGPLSCCMIYSWLGYSLKNLLLKQYSCNWGDQFCKTLSLMLLLVKEYLGFSMNSLNNIMYTFCRKSQLRTYSSCYSRLTVVRNSSPTSVHTDLHSPFSVGESIH